MSGIHLTPASLRRARMLRRRRVSVGALAAGLAVGVGAFGLEFAGVSPVSALGTTSAAMPAPTAGLATLLADRDGEAASRAAERSALPSAVAKAGGQREVSVQERVAQIDQARAVAAAERAAAKKAAAKKAAAKKAAARRLAAAQANPQAAAQRIMGEYGVGADQWGCLKQLWIGESAWNYRAANPSSGAYGIPQALPGSKMASAGADWQTNPETQIRWGLGYIKASYGTPCGALNFWNSHYPHWY